MAYRSPTGRPARTLSALLVSAVMLPGVASAQSAGESFTDHFGLSLRLGLEFETEPDAALVFQDFGSRVTWSDTLDTGTDLDVLALIDIGYGLGDEVFAREAWLGVEADFGTVKGGTQFRAFYDTVTSFTDVGWWDTCFLGVGCARTDGVLKYENQLSPTLRLVASTTLTESLVSSDDDDVADINVTGIPGLDDLDFDVGGDEAENEFIDQIEAGVLLESGEIDFGAAVGIDLTGDVGFAFGASAGTTLEDDLAVAAMVQFASEDYSDSIPSAPLGTGPGTGAAIVASDDSVIIASVSATKDRVYGIATLGDTADTAIGLTAGYVYPLVGGSKMYAEVSGIDGGTANSDFEFQARAVFVYHFGEETAARRR